MALHSLHAPPPHTCLRVRRMPPCVSVSEHSVRRERVPGVREELGWVSGFVGTHFTRRCGTHCYGSALLGILRHLVRPGKDSLLETALQIRAYRRRTVRISTPTATEHRTKSSIGLYAHTKLYIQGHATRLKRPARCFARHVGHVDHICPFLSQVQFFPVHSFMHVTCTL